jgi:hypothetical protein
MQKRLLVPSRVRRVPRQFSWVDQRLVRDHYLEHCDLSALALYLLLVTVADARGLSYYAEASIGRLLGLELAELVRARQSLVHADLIAYQAPLYQVLALPPTPAPPPLAKPSPARAAGELKALRELLLSTPKAKP